MSLVIPVCIAAACTSRQNACSTGFLFVIYGEAGADEHDDDRNDQGITNGA